MKKLHSFLLLALAAVTALSSCSDNNDMPNYVTKNKVVILNQGNYMAQDASVYVYDESTKEITPNAYATANNGTKLGATLMSGTFTQGGAAYLLCANPDKIETVSILDMTSVNRAVNDGIKNPREAVVGGAYLFVTNAGEERTDLGNGYYEYNKSYVSIYDISNIVPTLHQSVQVGSDAQGLAFFDNTIYVATKDGMVIIEKEGSNFIKRDTYKDSEYTGAVKYICAINDRIYASVPGYGIYEYDPYDKKVRKRYNNLPLSYDGYITADFTGNIYSIATTYDNNWNVVSSGAYQLNTSNGNVTTIYNGENVFSVGVSNYTGYVYTSEANGFITNSTMTVTNALTHEHVDTKTTGIGTFRYLFYNYVEQVK